MPVRRTTEKAAKRTRRRKPSGAPRAARSLPENELLEALHVLPVLLARFDLQGKVHWIGRGGSPRLRKLAESLDDLRHADQALGPAAAAELRERLARLAAGESMEPGEYELAVPGEEPIRLLAKAMPLRRKGVHEGFLVLGVDVTDRRQAERRRQESERRYRDLVDLGPDAVVVLQEGRYAFANPAFTRIFGYTADDVAAGLSFFTLVQEKDHPAVRERYEARLAGRILPKDFVLDLVAKDGRIVPCETSAVRIEHEGRPADLVVIRDITERRQAELTRQALEARGRQAARLEAFGRLAGGVAHDVNNLLVGVLGNAALALSELEPDAPARDSVEQIGAAAQRAAELARRMLAGAKGAERRIATVDLGKLLTEVLRLLERVVPAGVHVVREPFAGRLCLEADAGQLRQVVMNLVINGAEACGGGPGRVTLRAGRAVPEASPDAGCGERTEAASERVFLEVEDDGGGMDEATRSKMFEPFFSTKPNGHGLGLAAVQGIVLGHGGTIDVRTRLGAGTTVRVVLPVRGPGAGT